LVFYRGFFGVPKNRSVTPPCARPFLPMTSFFSCSAYSPSFFLTPRSTSASPFPFPLRSLLFNHLKKKPLIGAPSTVPFPFFKFPSPQSLLDWIWKTPSFFRANVPVEPQPPPKTPPPQRRFPFFPTALFFLAFPSPVCSLKAPYFPPIPGAGHKTGLSPIVPRPMGSCPLYYTRCVFSPGPYRLLFDVFLSPARPLWFFSGCSSPDRLIFSGTQPTQVPLRKGTTPPYASCDGHSFTSPTPPEGDSDQKTNAVLGVVSRWRVNNTQTNPTQQGSVLTPFWIVAPFLRPLFPSIGPRVPSRTPAALFFFPPPITILLTPPFRAIYPSANLLGPTV